MSFIRLSRVPALMVAIIAVASPGAASGPEQIEQLEPEGGEWQAEVSLVASRKAGIEPSFQLLRGLSDHLAIGIELEGQWPAGSPSLDSFAPTILYRFSDGDQRLGLGVVGQIEFEPDFKPVGAEARLLIERQAQRWWGEGNVILHVDRDAGQSTAALGYSWRMSRALGRALWLGTEGSGQVVRLSGSASTDDPHGHYLGPALALVGDLRPGEVEVNASYLRRIAGEGSRHTVQISAQINL